MRKLLVLLLLTVSNMAYSRQISESEAASIASEFFNSSIIKQSPAKVGVRRAKASKAANTDIAPFYVYNAEGSQGFVIVSGDDRAQRILGYSDRGSFDFDNLPPQLDDLLVQYEEQIKNIPANTATHDSWKALTRASDEGGVLLETANWGQGAPYNSQCPIIDGVQAPTGCVATAMAIVMKYHNWPATYNWADMSSEIGNGNEIASLLYDIGTIINTIYGTNESSAFVGPIPQYFYSQFDYDGDCQLIARSNFTDDEYLSYIKAELNEGRPVISFGSGSSGAHCFIFDGYDIDAMIHVNWGWDGVANGFYTLDSLIPDSRDFSNSNGIIIGLQPATSQSIEYSDYAYMDAGYGIDCICLQSGGGLSMDCENVTKNEDITVTYCTLNIKSDIYWGFALIDSSNNIKEIAADSLNFIQITENIFYPVIGTENKICFHSEISENDRLAIVARRQILSDPWKIVRGTIEAPSIIPAKGYNPPFASLIWNLDDNIEITLRHGREKQTYNSQTVPIKMLKGIFLDIMVSSENPGVVVLECDGVKYGRDINTYCWTYYQHKNGIGGSVDIINNLYNISAHLVPIEDCDDHVSVNVVTPGTLSEVIKSDKLITGLTISGSINDSDFEFLRSRNEKVLYLKKLDISDVSIFDKDGVMTNILPEHALEHHGFIQELVLPNNLREIADNALFDIESLNEINIPKSVTKIGRNALANNVLLRKIIVNNPEPFEIDSLAIGRLFSAPELILSVPVGAKPNYIKHSGLWSKFGKIVEGNKSADAMTLKVCRNGVFENLKADNSINYVHAHSIDILVEFSPKDAADYFYTWSSNPEYSFPNPRTYYLNDVLRFTISDDFTKEEGQSTFFVESSSGQKQSFIVNSYPEFKSFTITPEEISLKENEEIRLITNISPEYVYVPNIKWSSSDNDIVEVVGGHVCAHSSGSAIVTALIPDWSDGSGTSGTSASCKITVIKPDILVSSILLNPSTAEGKEGDQIQINATVLPEDATNKMLAWGASDESIATVSDSGLVSLIKNGQAFITASATDESGVSAECAVVVSVSTGIEDILTDKNTYVKIFNIQGIKVYEGIYTEVNLDPDYYIVVCDGKNVKVKIE